MTTKDDLEKLVRTKLALAEKYDKYAAEARSRPKRVQFQYKARRYRRQAHDVLGQLATE